MLILYNQNVNCIAEIYDGEMVTTCDSQMYVRILKYSPRDICKEFVGKDMCIKSRCVRFAPSLCGKKQGRPMYYMKKHDHYITKMFALGDVVEKSVFDTITRTTEHSFIPLLEFYQTVKDYVTSHGLRMKLLDEIIWTLEWGNFNSTFYFAIERLCDTTTWS